LLKQRRAAHSQLGQQVLPFVVHLARGNGDRLHDLDCPCLGAVKGVSASLCLLVDPGKIGVDRQKRLRMRREPLELRVVLVPARVSAKDCLGQQAFSPYGDEALSIQIFGM
jgi:hypothetical protein